MKAGKETYELVFGMKRLEMAEAAMGNRSIMAAFSQMPSIKDLLTTCAYGMRKAGQTSWVSPSQGFAAAETAMEEVGYMALYKEVSEALERDCGFLFRAAQ